MRISGVNAEENTCLIYLLKYIIQHQVYFDYGTHNHTHHNPHLEIKNIICTTYKSTNRLFLIF